jgi:energy-coupling factor transporter ATP-binding protein EcfA2
MTSEELIRIEGLSYSYPDGTEALKEVSLGICSGEFVAIIGQNGSGKTTLAKHFNGLLKPSAGLVSVCGQDTSKTPIPVLAKSVGYVFQNPDHQVFCLTVYDEVAFGVRNLDFKGPEVNERTMSALNQVGLSHLKSEHPLLISKGQRQLVAIASVLAMRPRIIVLDEPTTGLDWLSTLHVLGLINQLHEDGHTVVLLTHDMQLVAEQCQRAIVMKSGQVLIDAPTREAFSHISTMREAFIEPPQITQLAHHVFGERTLLTVDELVRALMDAKNNGS